MSDNYIWERLDLSRDVQIAIQTLENARLLLIGSGGIGSEIALKLAGNRIKQMTLVDGDIISLANIPHSSVFTPAHVNLKKVDVIAQFLLDKFPNIQITPIPLFIQQVEKVQFQTYDFIVCVPDNDKTRLWVNYHAVKYEKPVLFVGLGGPNNEWSGYTYLYLPHVSGCFLCLRDGGKNPKGVSVSYEKVPETADLDQDRYKCGDKNVAVPILPPVVGVMASYAASIVIKTLVGMKTLAYTAVDVKAPFIETVSINPSPSCIICGKIEEYDI